MSTIFWQILLQIVLIISNAIFACAEIAVISINDSKLERLAAAGDKRAIKLRSLTSQPAKFLATIQIAITLSGFLGSAFAADSFAEPLVDFLISLGVGISPAVLDSIAVIVITIILSYITLIFGELVPKRVAMRKSETLGLAMSGLIYSVAKISAPLVWLLTKSTNAVLRLIGIDPDEEDQEVTEEEIRMMVDVGSEKGAIEQEEKEIIESVFEFNDMTVGEVATHRKDMVVLWDDEGISQWEEIMLTNKHSRYPICHESTDNIIGILSIKDYFRLKNKNEESIKTIIRQPYFVPEGLGANLMFRKMKELKYHMAVVLDEYGGVYGIVTMNDLIQQLLGDEIEEEQEDAEIKKLDSNTWEISGTAEIDDVNEALELGIESEDYESFGGYVFGELGYIPEDGTSLNIDIENIKVRVISIEEHRLVKAIVTKKHIEEIKENKEEK